MKKSNKDRESEVLKVYNLYWDSYLNGYLETFASTMDDAFEMIGTSESEVCHSKEDGIEFYKAQIQEVVGKTEMRNRIISSKPLGDMFLVNEACDVYILGTPELTFYSKLRLSTILHETKSGWKIIQQHGSLPDMRVEKGETMAFKKITKENLELRDAVKRRTAELERKNRDLHVEAALEKVRALTMAMHSSEDVGKCIVKMFSELTALGVDEGTRFGIGILNHDNENNQLWTARKNGDEVNMHIGNIDMTSHPLLKSACKAWKEQTPFHKYVLEGEDLLDYYRMLNKAPDYKIQIPLEKLPKKEIQHCFIFEHGFFYAFSPREFQPELIHITKRFSSLFAQTYQRYLDLVRAEAQAHDAEIELALERVRARTMAMQHSDELTEASVVLDQQVRALGIETWGCAFHIYADDPEGDYEWFSSREGTLPFYKTPRENFFLKFYEKGKAGETFHVEEFLGDDCKVHYDYLMTIPVMGDALREIVSSGASLPESQYDHIAFFKHGFLLFITYKQVPESHAIFQRFAKVFEQTYTRFLDLQKAEAQAKEAKIEAALERVRSRTMAMHHTEELKEVIQVVFEQMVGLSIHVDHAGFILDYKEREDMHIWLADHQQGVPTEITIPYFDSPHWNSYLEAKAKGESFFANLLPFEVKNKFYRDLFELIPELTEEAQQAIFNKPGLAISTVLLDNVGLYIEHYSETLFNAEENAVLMRFGKVFQQTYTRFLDLQKAEAQGRESQINLAVERIRAMALAMHQTSELKEVIKIVDDQIKALNVDNSGGAFIVINEDLQDGFSCWGAGGVGNYIRKVDIPFLDRPIYKELKKGIENRTPFFTENYGYEEKWEFFKHLFKHAPFDETPPERQKALLSNSMGYARSCVVSNNTSIFIINHNGKAFKEDENKILREIGRVFEQAYTRFLDLQKAEAQAHEAKIEAALEKVRSRTMGMQSSEELPEVANLLFTEVRALGIHAWSCGYNILAEDKKTATCWMSSEGTIQTPFQLRLWGENSFDEMGEFVLSDQTMLVQELGGIALEEHYDHMKSFPDLKPTFSAIEAQGLSLPTYQINHLCKFSHGFLLFITYEQVPDAHDIFRRFTKIFDQTYTRFLDLQKAEAQAREARIEAALERVRSRTMGMQKAEELGEVATILFGEMNTLVDNLWTCGFVLCEKNRKEDEWWLSLTNGLIEPFSLPNVGDYAHETLYEGWEKGEAYCKVTLENERLQEHYDWLMSIPIARKIFEDMEGSGIPRPNWQRLHAAYFKTGYLVIITEVPCEEEEIFKRFAQVFDLTYTRFLDLQKAEKQAREAQIQAALEKVRSRSLAMQSPDELIEVAQMLREEMGELGVEELETSSIYIQDESSGLTECWFTIKNTSNPGKAVADQMTIKLEETWVGRQMRDFFQSSAEKTSILMQGKNRIEWIRYCEGKSKLFGTSNFYGETIPERTYHLYKFSNGYIGAAAPGEISSESWDLLKRATAVFSFAFTRFQDLQRAEASARAAMRQASLDRVRADISSMRSASDLDRITPLIFKELTVLGVPFIRCGVFIIQKKQKIVEAYLSSPEGNSLGVLRLPYQASELTYQTVEAWRKGVVYHQHWNKEDFIQWINQLMEQDQIQDSSTYQGTAAPPESLNLHFVPFTQGMLYVGAVNPLDDEELELVQALAKAFSIAYARFEDFVKLEQAKAEVESAMSELKATQSQLVQQEKLASLGQLTAGIAHEIKNPLNFVNNFSEVSIELVDEAIEERSKSQEARDETLVDEILEDIKSNLKKVHEHGSRANSIVTSMLQHSRGGSGKKEPTDLNALIKEYVNLSFHGMRAGKNPINVDIILDLDPEVKEVSLIKEDFTRVIINLCNNAFDAMRTVTTLHAASLRVRTKAEKDFIIIEVADNGPGIPEEIKDKILQPFFTTKKGTEGTGLGLSITHDIVKAHGGELRVESPPTSDNGEVRNGSKFIVSLPNETTL
ncbi:ATP-binding protein [Aquiflexum gelatinilyticum]|uniref:ATP-binding protein n=1 Tax=Aquiflexum gelatinilyticum TaxID=2961943 RepID=UPI00216A400E|nr:ATP-binding protein [Aquiflexum gelatinilyticum]MCS4435252.1 ATP-binding protein [Aquiflexum gelatinilyticum]